MVDHPLVGAGLPRNAIDAPTGQSFACELDLCRGEYRIAGAAWVATVFEPVGFRSTCDHCGALTRPAGRTYRSGNHAVTTKLLGPSRTEWGSSRRRSGMKIMKLALSICVGLVLGASAASAEKLTFALNWVAGG